MDRPFDLSRYFLDEIFKDSSPDSWPAGAFDYQLRLHDLPSSELDTICNWLSINCTHNYIVSLETLEIVSGGTTNNRLSWVQRTRKRKREQHSTIKIRLDKSDLLLFRMVWIL